MLWGKVSRWPSFFFFNISWFGKLSWMTIGHAVIFQYLMAWGAWTHRKVNYAQIDWTYAICMQPLQNTWVINYKDKLAFSLSENWNTRFHTIDNDITKWLFFCVSCTRFENISLTMPTNGYDHQFVGLYTLVLHSRPFNIINIVTTNKIKWKWYWKIMEPKKWMWWNWNTNKVL